MSSNPGLEDLHEMNSLEQSPCEPQKMDLVAKNASISLDDPTKEDPPAKDSANSTHNMDPNSKTNTTSSSEQPCEFKKNRPSYEKWYQFRY